MNVKIRGFGFSQLQNLYFFGAHLFESACFAQFALEVNTNYNLF